MECTIATISTSHQELYFGVQEFTGVQAKVYELSQEQVELIKTCTSEQVQSILYEFTQTCKVIKELPIK